MPILPGSWPITFLYLSNLKEHYIICRIIRQKLEYICPKEVVNVATENGMGLAETLPEHIYLLKNKNNSNSSWPTLVLCIFITQT